GAQGIASAASYPCPRQTAEKAKARRTLSRGKRRARARPGVNAPGKAARRALLLTRRRGQPNFSSVTGEQCWKHRCPRPASNDIRYATCGPLLDRWPPERRHARTRLAPGYLGSMRVTGTYDHRQLGISRVHLGAERFKLHTGGT